MPSLPGFHKTLRNSEISSSNRHSKVSTSSSPSEKHNDGRPDLTRRQLHRATRTRFRFSLLTTFCLFITVIFLILVLIGNTSNKPGLTDIWFINLNLSDVVPTSTPNANILNSIARTLGLHDFYQVGLWNYCEGYNNEGVTGCSATTPAYWFNPVAIIQNELLQGSTITLPPDLQNILNLIRLASRVMFAFFLTGILLSALLLPFTWTAVYSRWAAFALLILTFINAALVTVASIIATVLFVIMANVFNGNDEVNIKATIGTTMFALMWVASAGSLVAFVVEMALSCCCASRRDVRKGKKRGSRKAYV